MVLHFDWRGAKISGQAEQYKHDWSLVNITIDGLRLNEKQTQNLLSKKWDGAGIQINHINSLDILRSDVEWKSGHLAGFDASLENVQLPFQLWQQQQATFSLQAEGVTIMMMTCLSTRGIQLNLRRNRSDWGFLYAMATRQYQMNRTVTQLSWTRTTWCSGHKMDYWKPRWKSTGHSFNPLAYTATASLYSSTKHRA